MSPWLVGFTVFIGYPLVYSAYLSLHSYDLLSPPRWVGLANYRYLFTEDPEVGTAVRNTLWLVAIAVPLQVLFAFGIAVMVTRAKRGGGFFRTVFYLPALAPPVAAALGFVYLLNPATGPVNTILGWGKWGVLVCGVAGLLICGGKMAIGHRNRAAFAADGATGVPWVLAGLSLAAVAAAIAGVFL
jgi:ABC-type sugar transport system permease subunit